MNSLTDKYTLINSVEVPCIAFGTWKMPEEIAANAVKCAIESGYRHIDTAAAYQNDVPHCAMNPPEALSHTGDPAVFPLSLP